MTSYPRILTLTQWAGGANWTVELQHSNPKHVLIWQTRGQGRCVIEGIRRGFGVHTALAIPAGTMFSLELNKQSFGLVCLIPANSGLLMPDQTTILRIREVQTQAELTGILEAMQREQNAQRPFVDEALAAHGASLTIWLRRAMIADETAATKPTAAHRLVRAYTALVERNYTTGQPMADYARQLGVTPTHLTRVCRQSAGQTASELLTQRCLHEARSQLERGRLPIAQIAASLGFNSAGYFSRFVQHHTGCTPSVLRKRSQSDLPRPETQAGSGRISVGDV